MPVTPNTFYTLPPGASPTVIQVASAAGYCNASDVCSLNKARVPGVGNNPTISDINGYIEMTAGQIDGVLARRGYTVPVNVADVPEAEGLLNWINSNGAAFLMEQASPNSPNIDRFKDAFDAALEMLSSGAFTLNIPIDVQRGEARAPWITYTPTCETFDPTLADIGGTTGDGISRGGQNSPRNPYFSRSMRW